MAILFLLFVLFCTIGGQISHISEQKCDLAHAVPNVVGGVDITAQQVPWNAVLEIKKKENSDKIMTHCGGVIVSKYAILTAAHCIWLNKEYNGRHLCPENVRNQQSATECHQLSGGCPNGCLRVRPEDLNVYVGISNITQTERIPRVIERIVLHDLWNKSSSSIQTMKMGHDLALVILNKELEFNSMMSPICLPDDQFHLESNETVFVSGFGVTDVATRTLATHLQRGRLQIKAKDDCNVAYDNLSSRTTEMTIQGDQLCAFADDVDSCSGDSGSGLFKFEGLIPILVGTVSFGPKYCRKFPGVYTNVQTHVHWILQKLKEFPQTDQRCLETETCEARQTCSYIQQKYKDALETDSIQQQKNIVSKLKARVCNKKNKAFCCPGN